MKTRGIILEYEEREAKLKERIELLALFLGIFIFVSIVFAIVGSIDSLKLDDLKLKNDGKICLPKLSGFYIPLNSTEGYSAAIFNLRVPNQAQLSNEVANAFNNINNLKGGTTP